MSRGNFEGKVEEREEVWKIQGKYFRRLCDTEKMEDIRRCKEKGGATEEGRDERKACRILD
jgi:hypothetical protein